ncbi:hypothetical protein COU57_02540 [Candidatus Pacearchaeota archaeon CG10_big_fil_rev_8_21_14_0_10_32_14]|nr:MAG: hypothetical protein COU57_02540 [Candidatus Pacearchaeota archaeon CG10_big_fil_rev_8_21_14_0_10_32_14]
MKKEEKIGLVEQAYVEAIDVLKRCATPHGFHAAYPGYDAVWSRDSMITSLGASLLGKKFKESFKSSIVNLADHQSKKGQIPNAVDIFSKERKPHVDYMSIDSSLWFIIGEYLFKARYKDNSLMSKHEKNISKAFNWINYQDSGEDGMPEQQPTSDWFDAFPHRYGHTINTQALYYKALLMAGKEKEAGILKHIVNHNEDKGLWNGEFYYSWRWKNHNNYQEHSEFFDSLGNLMAIVYGLAEHDQAESILEHIKRYKIAQPYPIKTIYPPIHRYSKEWYSYFSDCEAGQAYHYSNAGIWTYIGGFYVLALLKQKKFEEAREQLDKLAEANLKIPYFTEWLHGRTGRVGGANIRHSMAKEGNQAWNAGMYILAYESVKRKRVLI